MNMKLKNIFRWTQYELKNRLECLLKRSGYNPISRDGFLYAKGELPVLLVAHLDTVHKNPVQEIIYRKSGRELWSPQGIGGDDRCGVYMILKIIKELRCHVLFCEDEECGGIGAGKFVDSAIQPNVNFIIEMDRRGSNDAVFYDCDNPDFTRFITSFGFTEEWGTFSDISLIAPALGVAAVNISSGYYHEHTLREYVDIEVVQKNIERIKKVIRWGKKRFEYIEALHYYNYGRYNDYYDMWISGDYIYNGYNTSRKNTSRFKCINANAIEDLQGYIITETGEFYDSDFYIGSDNKVYVEIDDLTYYCLQGARAFNAAGGNLRFCDAYPVYVISVSEMSK